MVATLTPLQNSTSSIWLYIKYKSLIIAFVLCSCSIVAFLMCTGQIRAFLMCSRLVRNVASHHVRIHILCIIDLSSHLVSKYQRLARYDNLPSKKQLYMKNPKHLDKNTTNRQIKVFLVTTIFLLLKSATTIWLYVKYRKWLIIAFMTCISDFIALDVYQVGTGCDITSRSNPHNVYDIT